MANNRTYVRIIGEERILASVRDHETKAKAQALFCSAQRMDQVVAYVKPVKEFMKDSKRLVQRCTKPDLKGKPDLLQMSHLPYFLSLASQTQPTPARIAFSIPVRDTESDPCWGWFGLACETTYFLSSCLAFPFFLLGGFWFRH